MLFFCTELTVLFFLAFLFSWDACRFLCKLLRLRPRGSPLENAIGTLPQVGPLGYVLACRHEPSSSHTAHSRTECRAGLNTYLKELSKPGSSTRANCCHLFTGQTWICVRILGMILLFIFLLFRVLISLKPKMCCYKGIWLNNEPENYTSTRLSSPLKQLLGEYDTYSQNTPNIFFW